MRDRHSISMANLLALQITMITSKNILCSNSLNLNKYNALFNIIILIYIFIKYFYINLKYRKIYINKLSMLILLTITLFWCVSYVIHPEILSYDYIVDDITSFIAYSLLALLIIPTLTDLDILKEALYKYVYIMFIATLIGFVLFYFNGGKDINGLDYSMSFGKNAVFPCIILMSKFKFYKKLYDLFFSFSIIIFMLLISSRFPLLYILIYVFLSLFLKLNGMQKIIGIVLISFIGFVIVGYNIDIMDSIFSKLSFINTDSRTLKLLIGGNIADSSGRNYIHEKLISAISNSPIIGFGAGGSVLVLNGELAHGFLYDSLATFGFLCGGCFIYITFTWIFKTWKKTRNNRSGELIIVLSSCFFPTIMLQDSLFSAYRFWWLLAICINIFRRNNNG